MSTNKSKRKVKKALVLKPRNLLHFWMVNNTKDRRHITPKVLKNKGNKDDDAQLCMDDE